MLMLIGEQKDGTYKVFIEMERNDSKRTNCRNIRWCRKIIRTINLTTIKTPDLMKLI